ncbi:hypothetical protein STEG23_030111 [Scotinomys teguina]
MGGRGSGESGALWGEETREETPARYEVKMWKLREAMGPVFIDGILAQSFNTSKSGQLENVTFVTFNK